MKSFRDARCAPWAILTAAVLAAPAVSLADAAGGDDAGRSSCHLAGGTRHVIMIQSDNVHLRRDDPNVPSDLEQLANLLNFLESQGTLLANLHTPLISHTADDIITTLTGNYGEKHGQPVANSYGYFKADGTVDPSASQTLGYLAQMLEAGVPVVYGYIADAHDNHFTFSGSYGPGEAGYVAQLAAYNQAFGRFFARLQADGITPENTLFIITADENDHFVGQPGTPAGCDGIHTPCTYIRLPAGCDGDSVLCTTTNLGEVGVDLRQLLLTELGDSTSLAVHSDDAPTVYLTGNPGPTATQTRGLEHNLAALVAFDPVTGTSPPLMQRMADPAEMAFLHMVTHDPARTPTVTFFGNDDFFITAAKSVTACSPLVACSDEQPGFNWNHGDFQRSITHTWLALAGPHVRRQGETAATFTDHTDVRPMLLHLTGLADDYAHDGRVIVEALDESLAQRDTISRLAAAYKQINAPLGELGRRTLMISTRALAGDDATYNALEEEIASVTAQRNAIAGRMIAILEAAAFEHAHVDEDEAHRLIDAAERLIASVR